MHGSKLEIRVRSPSNDRAIYILHIINTFKPFSLFCFVILFSFISLTFVLIPFALLRTVKAWEFHTITETYIHFHTCTAYMRAGHINIYSMQAVRKYRYTHYMCVVSLRLNLFIFCFKQQFFISVLFSPKCRKIPNKCY